MRGSGRGEPEKEFFAKKQKQIDQEHTAKMYEKIDISIGEAGPTAGAIPAKAKGAQVR